jgi:hypothetical protein
MKEAAGDAKKTTTEAISSGFAVYFRALIVFRNSIISSDLGDA